MKKTVTPLRSLCAALAALVLLVALAAPAFAADGFADLYYRMNDSAEVLTEDEGGELEASLEELSVRQSFDVIIATIDSLESEGCTSMEEYADDLYDYCQFGYGENRDGVLLLISTGDRKWHISTCGYGITAFTDAGIQYLGEQMTPDMADGDYAAPSAPLSSGRTHMSPPPAKATPTMWTTCPRSRSRSCIWAWRWSLA